MKTYEEYEYAGTRLHDTIVMLGTRAFYVHHVDDEEGVVTGNVYNPTEERRCDLEDLDITPVQLGYVNHDMGCTYVVRAPMREDWRQGLRYNSMRMADGRRADHIPMAYVAKTIEGKFPSVKECVGNARIFGPGYSYAFCRSFALNGDNEVFYKETAVGTIDPITYTITLNEKFTWLNETLEEELPHAD